MNYQVLARKWRPQTFAQVVGQQHVLQALTNALTHQRLHHAYLLTGTRGVGKTTIARILAKSLNCEQGISATPCGQCDTCLEIDQGRYVDLLEIDAASRTKVEDTRELLDNVQYRPTRGRYKVYLIDEVHMLSRHSFNALLKTLEEPPEHVKFLLATTDPEKLPVTVLSRCLQFHLRALSRDEISAQLELILKAESLSFDTQALQLLARAARGSMRDALSLTDQAIAQGNQSVALDSVRQMLGHIEGRRILDLLRLVINGDASGVLATLRAIQDHVADISVVLPELQNALHQLALLQVSADFADVDLFKDQQALAELAAQLAPEVVQVLYRLALEGRKELPHALDAYSAVEMTLLRMLAFRPATYEQAVEAPRPQGEITKSKLNDVDAEKVAEPEANQGADDHIASESKNTSSNYDVIADKPAVEEPVKGLPVADNNDMPTHSSETEALYQNNFDESDYSHDNTEDDDFLSPQEQAELAQEQTSILSQAQRQGHQQAAAAQSTNSIQPAREPAPMEPDTDPEPEPEPRQAPPAEPQPNPEQQISGLMATRQQLLAKKKDPLTPETRYAAQIDSWSASIDGMQVKGRLRQVLLHSVLDKRGDGYQLVVDQQQQVLCSSQLLRDLEAALRTLVGDVSLGIEYAQPAMTPYIIQQTIDAYRSENAYQQIKNDGRLQALLTRFDAVLDESSVTPL